MFAIINVKTGEFVYGTDYRYHQAIVKCSPIRVRSPQGSTSYIENAVRITKSPVCKR